MVWFARNYNIKRAQRVRWQRCGAMRFEGRCDSSVKSRRPGTPGRFARTLAGFGGSQVTGNTRLDCENARRFLGSQVTGNTRLDCENARNIAVGQDSENARRDHKNARGGRLAVGAASWNWWFSTDFGLYLYWAEPPFSAAAAISAARFSAALD